MSGVILFFRRFWYLLILIRILDSWSFLILLFPQRFFHWRLWWLLCSRWKTFYIHIACYWTCERITSSLRRFCCSIWTSQARIKWAYTTHHWVLDHRSETLVHRLDISSCVILIFINLCSSLVLPCIKDLVLRFMRLICIKLEVSI